MEKEASLIKKISVGQKSRLFKTDSENIDGPMQHSVNITAQKCQNDETLPSRVRSLPSLKLGLLDSKRSIEREI